MKLLDVNFQSPYDIARHLGYEDCIEILKSNIFYWNEELKRIKDNDIISLHSLQHLSLNTINSVISESNIEEFLNTDPAIVEVYLTKLCNSVIQDSSTKITKSSRLVEAFAASPKHRESMNIEALIKAASKRYFHTISCLENGYFIMFNKDHLISVFDQRDLFQYVPINPSEVFAKKMRKLSFLGKFTENFSG